jgi:hypothetical protein
MDSILNSIKKLLGIAADEASFDADVMMHINDTFATLNDLGVGPDEGFRIEDETSTWDEFLPISDKNFNRLPTYVYLKVKIVFDPTLSSSVLAAHERRIAELESRLTMTAETSEGGVDD